MTNRLNKAMAVLEQPGAALPALPLRDGALIDGLVCRLTIGVMALLEAAQCKILSGDSELSEYDVALALWLSMDCNRDDAVRIANDTQELERRIEDFAAGYSRKKFSAVLDEFNDWFCATFALLPSPSKTEGEPKPRPDWWKDAVDIIAHQYGWTEYFILWELPLVRVIGYQETIVARETGQRVAAEIDDRVIEALDLLEKGKEDG